MDRQKLISKIQAMLKLQEKTSFEGEASAAAALIDKLCKENGITLTEATQTQVLNENFSEFKRLNYAYSTLLNAVCKFYDASVYIRTADVKSFQVVGSEAQQIQVKLYFEYLLQVMEKECNVAHKGEKKLAELRGTAVSRSFKINFRKAFADKVAIRLLEMKIAEGRQHEDANAVAEAMSKIRLSKTKRMTGPSGAGAFAGADAGSSVSLNRQANGRAQRALVGV